ARAAGGRRAQASTFPNRWGRRCPASRLRAARTRSGPGRERLRDPGRVPPLPGAERSWRLQRMETRALRAVDLHQPRLDLRAVLLRARAAAEEAARVGPIPGWRGGPRDGLK